MSGTDGNGWRDILKLITTRSYPINYGIYGYLLSYLQDLVYTHYTFSYFSVILFMQFFFSLFLIEILRLCRLIDVTPYTLRRSVPLLIPSVIYFGYLWMDMEYRVKHLIDAPNYAMWKRFEPLLLMQFCALLGTKWERFRLRESRQALGALLLVIAGAVVASAIAPYFHVKSLLYGAAGTGLQILTLLSLYNTVIYHDYQAIEVLYILSFHYCAVFLIYDIATDSSLHALQHLMYDSTHATTFTFWASVVALCFVAFRTQFYMMKCMESRRLLELNVVGCFKSALYCIPVFFYLTGSVNLTKAENITMQHIVGCGVATAGILLYWKYKMPPQIEYERLGKDTDSKPRMIEVDNKGGEVLNVRTV